MIEPLPLYEFLHSTYIPSRLGLSPERVRQLEICIRQIEAWAGRTLLIGDLTETLIRSFLSHLHLTHAPSTVNTRRGMLLSMCRCAWDEELLPAPPRAAKIRRAKTPPGIPSAWTTEEIGRVFAEASQARGKIDGIPAGDWWLSILSVAYDTGERRTALLMVSPGDMSLDRCSIVFLHRKGGRQRWCPLHKDTVAVCEKIYDPCRPLMWPFSARREALDDRFRWILKRAGVRHAPRMGLFHAMRRSSGTIAEANGADGARLIGCTRKVFEQHYLDPRFLDRSQLDKLPRP
jgi:integrase